ncbi:hypothetical protein DSO57_1031345 [Entomophthora muscae]|uniref:Uncharacterized protein n=1 Tax=Entomophthora muscae TaxID=34485 RepID=A0ACC2RFD9_9FUNG|nr:hypothetical protein DSO57_1031345 [Entomophthora muscae]
MSSAPSNSREGKELVMVPEGILMAQSMAACNFPKFSGNNVEWWMAQYKRFCKEYLVSKPDMVFNVCQFLAKKPTKWHNMALKFDSWDEWKSMATKRFSNKHVDIIKKPETIQIQEYKSVDEFIDAYCALARLSIRRDLQKGHKGSRTKIKTDFNTGIGLTFFKCAIPLEYCMAIEEHGIEDPTDAYNLVEKFYRIKVENLPDEKARKASAWNPFSKKTTKEPKQADLSDKLTKVLKAFMANDKPAPRYNNGFCFNCQSTEHQAKDCLEKYQYCKEDHSCSDCKLQKKPP